MEKVQAKSLIEKTFNNKFDKDNFRNFVINLLDGIKENKAFSIGQAQVKECFRSKVLSYQRLGQYIDNQGNIIDVLTVHLTDNCSLDRNRTFLRNFVADYMRTRQKENTLVAFYNDTDLDWRFSFVKLDISLKQDDKGNVKAVNEFTPAKRYSFLVGQNEPNHTAQSRLVELLAKDYPTLSEIEESFNVEKVSKEFFANYKELFLQLVDNLKEIRANEPNQRINTEFTLKSIKESDFCKKLLGQLVFLYFIQKKGWLGVPVDKSWGEGDKQFLRHTFEKAVTDGKNFFNDFLEPLFYEALATDRDNSYFSLLNCKIPFLNGGLFETIGGYSWTETDIIFDNSIFSNTVKTKNGDIGTGILDVFDRYNFTVKEDEPLEKEVAVDPEMLGKVFEELLEIQDRKSKGAFYTPREIVHYMCQESLINYLCTTLDIKEDEEQKETNIVKSFCNFFTKDSENLTKQDIADFIHHSDKLSQVELVATEKEGQNSKYKHKIGKCIIANAQRIDKALEDIKICDPAIGSGAFPVGMLNEIVRARIALVESGFLKETKKRSIYEYKRQAIQNSIYGVDIEPGAVEIAKLRLWLSLVVEEDDINNIKALPNLDYKIVQGNSLLNVERNLFNDSLFRKLEELKPQFFNETRKSEKKRLKKEIDAIIKELTKDGTFDFEIYFSEVFHEKGGFDVVIGNPPYFEYDPKTDEHSKQIPLLKKTDYFTFAKGGKLQAFKLFIAKTLMHLNKVNGVNTLIFQNSFLGDTACKNIRKYVLENKILCIDSFPERDNVKLRVFENVKMSVCVLQTLKSKNNDDYKFNVKFWKEKYMLNKKCVSFTRDEIFLLDSNSFQIPNLTNKEKNILTKIKKQQDLHILCSEGEINMTFHKHLLNIESSNPQVIKGAGVQRYFKTDHMSQGILEYLNEKQYLQENKGEKSRHHLDYRIAMQGISGVDDKQRLIATLIPNNYYLANSCNYILNSENYNLKYVLSIFNSKLMNWVFKCTSTNSNVNCYEVELMPFKNDSNMSPYLISMVDKILAITQTEDYLQNQEKQNAVKEYEKKIDIMVYKLYDLTYDEVLTIDKDFTLTEQKYNDYQL